MNALSRLNNRVIQLFATGLMLAGIVLVLHSAGLLLWQYVGMIESRAWTPLPARLWFVDHDAALRHTAAAGVLPFIPELNGSWLTGLQSWPRAHEVASWILGRLHIGVLPAAIGVLLAMAGYLVGKKQRHAASVAKQRTEDRLRRRREYRGQPAL